MDFEFSLFRLKLLTIINQTQKHHNQEKEEYNSCFRVS